MILRFFREEAIGGDSGDGINDEVVEGAVRLFFALQIYEKYRYVILFQSIILYRTHIVLNEKPTLLPAFHRVFTKFIVSQKPSSRQRRLQFQS